MSAQRRGITMLAILLASVASIASLPTASAHCPITPVTGTPVSDQVQHCLGHAVEEAILVAQTGEGAAADVIAILLQALTDLSILLQDSIDEAEPILQTITSIEFLVALFNYVRCRAVGPSPCIPPEPLPPI